PGVITINGIHGYQATAIVLSRDGIAITDASASHQRWLWAEGMEGRWPVRTLRSSAEVAVLELACRNACHTVVWQADSTLRDKAKVLLFSGPSRANGSVGGVRYGWRRLRAKRDRNGMLTWTLKGRAPTGGEAVARDDGMVVGLATRNRIVP